ncbi:MAG: NAD(P)/FAD-dependent oxidoreductase [Myxococcota bacterium]
MPSLPHVDVLIVGAGISGIGAAYHLQDKCPDKSFLIVERRERLGGTWDLFRYPGIRSDSDMHTFGFAFRPWSEPKVVASGPAILDYLDGTATAYGVHDKIRYRHRIDRASWSSRDARWTVHGEDESTGEAVIATCSFLFMCSGYYDYDRGYLPEFEGMDRFGGRLVHPQAWSDDIAYEGKQVVVIGSGATAVTLIPELAKTASHVTMLQRSPTYIVGKPNEDRIANALKRWLPDRIAYGITRWKNVFLTMLLYGFSRWFPERAKRFLVGQVQLALGEGYDVETHFTPRYDPWDQRVCLAPDGDFFDTLRGGRASVVTDTVDRFTEDGIRTGSGRDIPADIVVAATGLNLKFLGGVSLEVDGEAIDLPKTVTYKGMMCSGVPNMAMSLGYSNASWTLKSDLTAEYVCRLLNHMDDHGYAFCCPRFDDPTVEARSMLPLTSGYVQRGRQLFPQEGSRRPWRLHQNYALDLMELRMRSVDDGAMRFEPAPREGLAQAVLTE